MIDTPTPETESNATDFDSKAIDCLVLLGAVPAVHAYDVLELFKETFGADIVRDIVAFCDKHSEKHPATVLQTLAHDIGGALRRDKLMLPRVSGAYSE